MKFEALLSITSLLAHEPMGRSSSLFYSTRDFFAASELAKDLGDDDRTDGGMSSSGMECGDRSHRFHCRRSRRACLACCTRAAQRALPLRGKSKR